MHHVRTTSLTHSLGGRYSARFSILMFVATIVNRLASILILAPVVRIWDRRLALPLREQLAFAVAGMIRGNIAWAQALQVCISSPFLSVVVADVCINPSIHPFLFFVY